MPIVLCLSVCGLRQEIPSETLLWPGRVETARIGSRHSLIARRRRPPASAPCFLRANLMCLHLSRLSVWSMLISRNPKLTLRRDVPLPTEYQLSPWDSCPAHEIPLLSIKYM